MSLVKNMVWSPLEYVEASVIAREVADEMLSRLQWMAIKPNVIVDVGCGTGEDALRLQASYPHARVIALDNVFAMVAQAKKAHPDGICALGESLPLPDQSVDFIFANLLLPWQSDNKKMLKEWRRVLRPDGLLLFSTLGLDTLREYKSQVETIMAPQLCDMHDIGDELMAAGFSDPVLDVNYYTTSYRSKEKLMAELRATGMIDTTLINVDTISPIENDAYHVTYEVVIGHAFSPQMTERPSSSNGEFTVPVSMLKRTV